MWFIYAIISVTMWGLADLFYKKGADETKTSTHLKTGIMVGLVMGIHAIYMLIFGNINYDFSNIIRYLPVSIFYISSMILGYFGLRYLELSISSPIQNTSGVIVCVLCFLLLHQSIDTISTIAIICICIGTILLGIFEKKESIEEKTEKKYKIGFIAFFIPIFYCILDAIGTFLDAFYLDSVETTPLIHITEETLENVANTSYELTFFIVAIILIIILKVFKKEKMEIITLKNTGIAAICETAGQFFYVYSMGANAILAAPMVSAYCIVSMLLSRIVLKEKLVLKQYLSISLVVIGIILLGIAV